MGDSNTAYVAADRPDPAGRPATTAACLDEVVEWLDTADRAFELLAALAVAPPCGEPWRGRSVQGDLRLLAGWLRQHPDVDAAMFAYLDAVEAPATEQEG